MSDYISREAAIDALANAMPSLTTPDGRGEFDHEIQIVDETFVDAMQIIHDMPSVEAEPVRHGKWLTDNDAFKRMYLVCSLCKRATQTPWYVGGFLYNYCPNCGARMDGEQE